ncbi:MAG TPA: sulfite exporter TauE/SafE family protein [Candidatus Limnocylindrales bacterium]|nr:sulfite exporter TauE/SafE family protein [Candidatus Limnocylindrales bacterium]
MLLTAIFVASFFAGVVNSFAGGGIIILFPALLAAGLPAVTANATSNLSSWPGALTSAYGYRHYLAKLPRKYLLLLIPCFIGAVVGSWLLAHTNSTEFERAVPYLVLAAVLLFMFQPLLHSHLASNLKHHRTAPLVLIGVALIPMAIYGGYFGAGFGFIMLAFLGFTHITNLHQINGLNNLAGATISLVCTVYFSWIGLINWQYGNVLVVGSLLGGFVGSRIAQRLNPAYVHLGIVVLGLIVAGALFATQRG